MLDEPTAAMLTRWTARISVTLYLVWLYRQALLRQRRGLDEPAARRQGRLFVLFAAGHYLHLACLLLLAYATAGASVELRGGWLRVTLTGGMIYLAIAMLALAHLNLLPGAERIRRLRSVEFAVALLAWIGFNVAYVGRAVRDPAYIPVTALLWLGFAFYAYSLRAQQPVAAVTANSQM